MMVFGIRNASGLAAALLVGGLAATVGVPDRATAATAADVAVAIQSGSPVDACRSFSTYHRDSSGFNTYEQPGVRERLVQGHPVQFWYELATAAAGRGDHATACLDFYRALLAERLSQGTPDYDQQTLLELEALARKEAAAAQQPFRLAPNASLAAPEENQARYEFVYHHPSVNGLPKSCQANWSGSPTLSRTCSVDLLAQAEIERKSGDCKDAVIDYENARTAIANVGMSGTDVSNSITNGMVQCQAH